MSSTRAVITRRIPLPIIDGMATVADLQIWEGDYPIPRDTLLGWVQGAEALYCLLTDPIDAAVLDAAGTQLRVVSQMAVGYDNIDVAACTARGIPVGNTPGVLTETTADLTLALMLATARRVHEAANFVRQGRWQTWRPMELTGTDFFGSTVGTIGMGRIGMAVARRLTGFGCRILYANPSPVLEAQALDAEYVDLSTLLQESDFVSLHCPLNENTRHLIGEAELDMMKSTAFLVNTARGPVVNEEALLAALYAGKIAGAGLDVTDPEPIHTTNPLLQMPNVLVLPHIGSASTATRTLMARMAADNLVAGLKNERLPNCVNPEVYQR